MGGCSGSLQFQTFEYYSDDFVCARNTLDISAKNDLTFGSHAIVTSNDEFLFAGHDITLAGEHTVGHVAVWESGHAVYLEGTAQVNTALFIVSDDVYFEHADLTSPHIYVLDTAHVHCSNDSYLSTQIEYMSLEEMQSTYTAHMG